VRWVSFAIPAVPVRDTAFATACQAGVVHDRHYPQISLQVQRVCGYTPNDIGIITPYTAQVWWPRGVTRSWSVVVEERGFGVRVQVLSRVRMRGPATAGNSHHQPPAAALGSARRCASGDLSSTHRGPACTSVRCQRSGRSCAKPSSWAKGWQRAAPARSAPGHALQPQPAGETRASRGRLQLEAPWRCRGTPRLCRAVELRPEPRSRRPRQQACTSSWASRLSRPAARRTAQGR
jgi:hypothetical protein